MRYVRSIWFSRMFEVGDTSVKLFQLNPVPEYDGQITQEPYGDDNVPQRQCTISRSGSSPEQDSS